MEASARTTGEQAVRQVVYRLGNEEDLSRPQNDGACIDLTQIHPTTKQMEDNLFRRYPDIPHKFVVRAEGSTASIYVMGCRTESDILERYGLKQDEIAGGGVIYRNYLLQLVFTGYSMVYRAIPKEAGEEFGRLLVKKLADCIYFSGAVSEPTWIMHQWWRQFGFSFWKQDISGRRT